MTTDRINYLLSQYLDDKATITERDELAGILSQPESIPDITDRLQTMIDPSHQYPQLTASKLDEMLQSVLSSDKTGEETTITPVRRMFTWKKIAVAASIILIIGLGTAALVGVFTNKKGTEPVVKATPSDVKAPETNRAQITLADGRIVYLDSATNGELFTQNNIKATKTADGKIIYSSTAAGVITADGVAYNTLSNPRGSKVIDITLADGSRVWLNAGSSITYPVAFIGNERKVTITGEAYFEVAHEKAKPFYVSKGDVSVQVLGTHFNVNAYDDEGDIKVTLLEGSVKVLPGTSVPGTVIKPGQQAQIKNPANPSILKILVQDNIDVNEVMAWKNGLFNFNGADLQTILRQLARWYDVEVVFEKTPQARRFVGEMQRSLSLAQVLKILEKNGIQYTIEGKKLIIRS